MTPGADLMSADILAALTYAGGRAEEAQACSCQGGCVADRCALTGASTGLCSYSAQALLAGLARPMDLSL